MILRKQCPQDLWKVKPDSFTTQGYRKSLSQIDRRKPSFKLVSKRETGLHLFLKIILHMCKLFECYFKNKMQNYLFKTLRIAN